MDWKNIQLNDNYERNQNILDGYSFDTLLLEVHCNLKEINTSSIRTQFMESLNSKIQSAKEVFENNLINIVEQAKKIRIYIEAYKERIQ